MRSYPIDCLCVMTLIACSLLGCARNPSAVTVPAIDAEAVTTSAFATLDRDADGKLSFEETADAPGLRAGARRLDQDGDSAISQSELSERLAMWSGGGIGVSTLACRIVFRGQPLAGAEVRFVPESFLTNLLSEASGTTDREGVAMLSIDTSLLPTDQQNLQGVQQGFYRVEVTHPEITLPPKYNTATELGKEVSFELGENVVTFSL